MSYRIIQSQPRPYGKSTLVTNAFLADCKAGKSVILQHPDYVAMSRKSYESWVEDICRLIDGIELSYQDTTLEEWKAFKHIRNAIRDKYMPKYK